MFIVPHRCLFFRNSSITVSVLVGGRLEGEFPQTAVRVTVGDFLYYRRSVCGAETKLQGQHQIRPDRWLCPEKRYQTDYGPNNAVGSCS